MPNPSATHQTLLMWAVRKMQADGFVPMACDGRVPQFDCERRLPYPPTLHGLRPDAVAYSSLLSSFAFAEAKTEEDLNSEHTKRQFHRYAALLANCAVRPECLYISSPRSAATALDRLLKDVGLIAANRVRRLHIPDCLIADRSAAHA